jgi:hypothetical protein
MSALSLCWFRRAAVRLPLIGVGLATVLLLGRLSLGPLAAQEPTGLAQHEDVRYTLLARQALGRDPLLAPLNLGVRVHRRVAVLWGPIPSTALKARAEQVLRQLPDLLDVRNQLHVVVPDQGPPQYLPETLPPAVSGSGPWRAFALPAENVRLRPSLEQAIDRLRGQEPRFAGLRAEVRGSQVRLSGTVCQLQDAYDLAAAISRLPGVDRVTLDEVRSTKTSTNPTNQHE